MLVFKIIPLYKFDWANVDVAGIKDVMDECDQQNADKHDRRPVEARCSHWSRNGPESEEQ